MNEYSVIRGTASPLTFESPNYKATTSNITNMDEMFVLALRKMASDFSTAADDKRS